MPREVPEGRLRRRHLYLVDQVAEEGRLGQDLDVEEGRDRLERDRRQLLAPMQPEGGVDVVDRGREDEPPGELADPAADSREPSRPPPADDVVAMADRPQEGIDMVRRADLA
ncbi:MAG TPA: hypothetical protein VKP69_29780 [Isosphaeraceae bacterium]|nr:hypothetical protein [Isosphaeraceae bacterium]